MKVLVNDHASFIAEDEIATRSLICGIIFLVALFLTVLSLLDPNRAYQQTGSIREIVVFSAIAATALLVFPFIQTVWRLRLDRKSGSAQLVKVSMLRNATTKWELNNISSAGQMTRMRVGPNKTVMVAYWLTLQHTDKTTPTRIGLRVTANPAEHVSVIFAINDWLSVDHMPTMTDP